MAADDTQTINTEAASSAASPAPGREDAQTMPTVDARGSSAATQNTDTTQDDGEDTGKEATSKDETETFERFDKHPRFRELNARAKESEARAAKLETELELLRAQMSAFAEQREQQPKPQEKITYRDITTMTPEELVEWQTEKPVEYAANLYAQIRAELKEEMKREEKAAQQEKVTKSVIDEYRAENPDFDTMWSSGDIKKFMASHPGHTPISAHMMMTREQRTDEAIKAAVKAKEDELTKQFKAKRNAAVLGTGPAAKGHQPEKILENTKHAGGLTSALAQRLRAFRQQTG